MALPFDQASYPWELGLRLCQYNPFCIMATLNSAFAGRGGKKRKLFPVARQVRVYLHLLDSSIVHEFHTIELWRFPNGSSSRSTRFYPPFISPSCPLRSINIASRRDDGKTDNFLTIFFLDTSTVFTNYVSRASTTFAVLPRRSLIVPLRVFTLVE